MSKGKYIDYLEDHLGAIECGWSADADGNKLPFQIVKFSKGPFPDTVTYSTLGLSDVQLPSPVSNQRIRHELILVSYTSFGDGNIPGVLQRVGLDALKNGRPYLRGDVIGPYGTLFESTQLEALYVTMPVYFSDSFFTFDADESDIPIVQAWVVPITRKEANFVKQQGWSKFEDMLENSDPDLVDFHRASIIS